MSESSTEPAVRRIFTLEVIVPLIAVLVTFMSGYAVLADDQGENSVKIEKIVGEQRGIRQTLRTVEKEVAVIVSNQEHFKRENEDIKLDIREILKLIRTMPKHNGNGAQ